MVVARFSTRLRMIYRIEAEKFKGAVISRVYFKGEPETSHSTEGEIFARRLNDSSCLADQPHSCSLANDLQSCATVTVYVKVRSVHSSDFSRPVLGWVSKLLPTSQQVVPRVPLS